MPPKRKVIREDIPLEVEDQYVTSLKQFLGKQGRICYEQPKLQSTHTYINLITNGKKSFLNSKLNGELRGKVLKKQQQLPEIGRPEASAEGVTFQGSF